MSSMWTDDELRRIGGTTELHVASLRPDGTLRPFVTIWGVQSGSDLYIRSAYGPENGWYRRAVGAGTGRVRAGGIEHDVRFQRLEADDHAQADIDEAYHAKYDRYGPQMVGGMVGSAAAKATLHLLPR
jgi:hypothetical protein